MGKRVGRIPVEVNISAPQDNHIPIFDLETRLWNTIDTGSLFSGIFSGSNSFSGSQIINGDLTVSGSIYAYNITSSLYGTASVSQNSISASYLSGSQGIVNTFTSSGDIAIKNIVISTGKLIGLDNLSIGSGSLVATSSIPVFGGDNNIAIGSRVLAGPIMGSGNTAVGYSALKDYTASYSTAIGSYALWKSVNGRNTAVGQGVLPYMVTGTQNTAVGDSAMFATTTATNNTAIGNVVLRDFREGIENTAIGSGVMYLGFLTGSANTVIGFRSGEGIVTGSNNTIIGANVIGLPSILNNNIILADGQGNIRARYSSSIWTLSGSVLGDFTGSLFGTASWANNAISSSNTLTASHALNAVSSSYPFRVTGSSIYSFDTDQVANIWTIAIGRLTGYQTTAAPYSTFLGAQAGFQAVSASRSVFIGDSSGYQSTKANSSFFAGSVAGAESPNANNSVFIGTSAGYRALNASGSVFLGYNAGEQAINSAFSTIIGYNAGEYSHSSSFSTLIGYNVGARVGGSGISSNNIIIGTNITLGAQRQNSINLGGLIFGTGSYSTTTGNPFSGSANGRIGINQPFPIFSLDVSGSGRYTNGLQVTGSLFAPIITGSLFGTASWAQNAISASYVDASNVQGLSLFRISTGSISASLSTSPEKLFLINSESVNYFNISSSGNAEIYSNLFIVKNFTTNQPVFTVSQSIVNFATQSIEPTGTTEAGSIWFTSTNMYIGLE